MGPSSALRVITEEDRVLWVGRGKGGLENRNLTVVCGGGDGHFCVFVELCWGLGEGLDWTCVLCVEDEYKKGKNGGGDIGVDIYI